MRVVAYFVLSVLQPWNQLFHEGTSDGLNVCLSPLSYVKALTPTAAVFGNGDSVEVIK